jgi:hypothetical protein
VSNQQSRDGMSPSRKRMAMRIRRRCEDTPPYLWLNTYASDGTR